jgi:hypothetical protein
MESGLQSGDAGAPSKPGLHRRQPTEKSPGQAGVIRERYALSFGNHARYIAVWPGSDNELGLKEKGAELGPLIHS